MAVQYPNSPLVEVVFEIRFAPVLEMETCRSSLFDEVRNDFPTVHFPELEAGKAPALQPYKFSSKDEQDSLILAVDRFAYATRRYSGFEPFKARTVDFMNSFCRRSDVGALARTGLRYINVIPFTREADVIPWHRYFTVKLVLPEVLPSTFLDVSLALRSKQKSGTLSTRIQTGSAENGKTEAFILDFDFVRTDELHAKDVETYLEDSHHHTKQVFEKLLADDYRAVMRGETVE